MIVTIDEARVGHPSIKLDGMELAGMVKSYTLRHGVDEAPVLELELHRHRSGRGQGHSGQPACEHFRSGGSGGNDRRPGKI